MTKEELIKIEDAMNKLTEVEKDILNKYLSNHNEEYQKNPIDTVRKGLKYVAEALTMNFINRENKLIEAEEDENSLGENLNKR